MNPFLFITPFFASMLLIYGVFLLQVCSQHNFKDVKAEYIVVAILFIISGVLWVVFANLLPST